MEPLHGLGCDGLGHPQPDDGHVLLLPRGCPQRERRDGGDGGV